MLLLTMLLDGVESSRLAPALAIASTKPASIEAVSSGRWAMKDADAPADCRAARSVSSYAAFRSAFKRQIRAAASSLSSF